MAFAFLNSKRLSSPLVFPHLSTLKTKLSSYPNLKMRCRSFAPRRAFGAPLKMAACVLIDSLNVVDMKPRLLPMVMTPTSRAASRPNCNVSFVFTLAASHFWLPLCPKLLSLSSGRFAQVCAFKLPQSQTSSASSSPPLLMGPRSRVKSPLLPLRVPFYPNGANGDYHHLVPHYCKSYSSPGSKPWSSSSCGKSSSCYSYRSWNRCFLPGCSTLAVSFSASHFSVLCFILQSI